MLENLSKNKRIAKNTLLLYFRMMFIMAVSLYTSRVVLNTLGVEDYGIYNVVGGVVAMFGFLNAAMTTSTQRYITYELGKGNSDRLKQVFSTSVNIHILISVVVVFLAETIGIWFLNEKMVIPVERMYAAMWVFQLSILSTVIAILSYPYNAAIVAHEKMSAFAYISVLEVVLKLAIVYLLIIWDIDKLILYAALITLIQVSILLCYRLYCKYHFTECIYHFYYEKILFKEMLTFAGWNLWGNLAGILFSQGLNMLLNVFFGPAINAARAVAVQVQGAIQQFSTNFQMALNPQITKKYATGHLAEMHKLVFRSSKFTFFLLLIICLPVLIETPFILEVWLKNVPDFTIIFLRIMIVTMIIDATANPLMVSAAATGNVKKYQSVVGGILLAILPISYIVLKLGGAPWSVFLVHFLICCIAYISRLFIVRPLIKLHIRVFIKEVFVRCSLVSLVSVMFPLATHLILSQSMTTSILVIITSVLSSSISSFYLGLDKYERNVIVAKICSIKNKITAR